MQAWIPNPAQALLLSLAAMRGISDELGL